MVTCPAAMGSKDHSPQNRASPNPAGRSPVEPEPLWSDDEPDGLFDPDRALEQVRARQDAPLPAPEEAELPALDSEPPPPDGEISGELPVPPLEDLGEEDETSDVDEATGIDTHIAPAGPDVDPADPRFETPSDPRIPEDVASFKIGEVARIVGVRPYVLRYWESELDFIKPEKTETGQRRFRRDDVATLLQVKRLRHEAGLTMAQTRNLIVEGQASQLMRVEPDQGSAAWMVRDADAKSRIRGQLLRMREAVLDLLHAVEGEEESQDG